MKKYIQRRMGTIIETIAEFDLLKDGEKQKARNRYVDEQLKTTNKYWKIEWSDIPSELWSRMQVHREKLNLKP